MTRRSTREDCNYTEVNSVARRTVAPDAVVRLVEFRPRYVVFRTLALASANVAIWAAALTLPLWVLVIAFPLMVVVQQEMLIWVHEGAHRTLFRNRTLNDFWVGFWFASPLGVNFETYRRSHMTHHSLLASAADGDRWTYELYIRGAAFKRVLLKAVLGYYGVTRASKKYATAQYDRLDPDKTYPPTIHYVLFMLFWNGAFIAASVLAEAVVGLSGVVAYTAVLHRNAGHSPAHDRRAPAYGLSGPRSHQPGYPHDPLLMARTSILFPAELQLPRRAPPRPAGAVLQSPASSPRTGHTRSVRDISARASAQRPGARERDPPRTEDRFAGYADFSVIRAISGGQL